MNCKTLRNITSNYLLVLLLICFNTSAIELLATTKTWDGEGIDDNWTTAANWDSDIAPVATDDLVFAGSTRTAPVNDFAAATNFASITFSLGASAFTLSGNSVTITGGASAITANNTSLTMTIGNDIVFSSSAPTITNTAGGTLNITGTITNGGFDLSILCAGTSTYSGVISGTGAFTKSGAGTLTLSAANTYTGATKISDGTISASAENNLGAPSGSNFLEFTGFGTLAVTSSFTATKEIIANGASRSITIDVASGQTLTLTDDLRAYNGTNPPVYKTGDGTFIQTASSGWCDGGFYINAGIMEGQLSSSFGDGGSDNIYLAAGVTARFVSDAAVSFSPQITVNGTGANIIVDRLSAGAGLTQTVDKLIVSGAYTVNISVGSNVTSGTAVFGVRGTTTLSGNVNFAVTTLTASFLGVISGTADITKSGTGIMALSAANTFVGNVNISAGTLKLLNWNLIPDASTVAITGTFDLNGNRETIASFTGAGTIDNVGDAGTAILTFGADNSNVTFSGLIKNTTGGTQIIKTGTGTFTPTNANTYTGGTKITGGGAISISAENNVGAPSDSKLVDFTGLGTLYVTASFSTAYEITADGASAGMTINIAAGQTLTQTGATRSWGGGASVYKTGTGTWISGGDGGWIDSGFEIQAGTVEFRQASAWGDNAANIITVDAGTTLRLSADAGFAVTGCITIAGTGANIIVDRVSAGAGVTHTFNNFVINGAYTVNVSAGSNVTSGTEGLTARGTTSLNGNTIFDVTDPGAADILLTHTGNVNGTNTNLTMQGTGNSRITGIIGTAAATLVKSGSGTLTIAGANTYSSSTTINAGTLKLGAAGVIPNGSAVTVTGTLDMNSFNETVGSITGAGTIENASGGGNITLTTGGDNSSTTFSGIAQNTSGTLSISKSGSGTFTLSGANTYTGTTTTTAGTVELGASGVLSNSSNFVASGGILSTGSSAGYSETAGTITLTANTTIALATGNHTLTFAPSNATSWTGGTLLRITGWYGGYNSTAAAAPDPKIFSGSSAELSAGKLAQIFFTHPISGMPYTSTQLASGEVVPTNALPVELAVFTGHIENELAHLNWLTASEINSDYFEILSSTDGLHFTAITSIKAAGNSFSFLNYIFIDQEKFSGVKYYKLVEYDNDGSFQEFKTIALRISKTNEAGSILIFPNPASESTNITFIAKERGNFELSIFDAIGRELMRKSFEGNVGENIFKLNTETFSAGKYFVNIIDSKQVISTSLLIIK